MVGLLANWLAKKLPPPLDTFMLLMGLGPMGLAPMGAETVEGYPRYPSGNPPISGPLNAPPPANCGI